MSSQLSMLGNLLHGQLVKNVKTKNYSHKMIITNLQKRYLTIVFHYKYVSQLALHA